MAVLTDDLVSAVQRERDVSRVFTLQRAEENAFTTMARKGPKPRSTLYEWPFKKRFTPVDSAILDGADVTSAEFTNNEANKSMIQGRVQKGRIALGVGDIAQEFTEEYAAKDLLADNLMDGIIQARENMEVTCLKNGDSNAINDPVSGPAAKLRGMANWIRTINPIPGDLPIPADALCPAGNIKSGVATPIGVITDTDFNAIMKSIASASFMKGTWDVFVTPDMMQQVDSYGNVAQVSSTTVPLRRFNKDMADGTITMMIRLYQTSFGLIRFHLHYAMPAGVHALIIQMEHVAIRPGYPVRTREIPYLGGAHKRIIEYAIGLDVTNPRAMGIITT